MARKKPGELDLSRDDAFIPWRPAAAVDGMKLLTEREDGVYRRLIDQLYMAGGELVETDRTWVLMKLPNRAAWNKTRDALQTAGKIDVDMDGTITQATVTETLKTQSGLMRRSHAQRSTAANARWNKGERKQQAGDAGRNAPAMRAAMQPDCDRNEDKKEKLPSSAYAAASPEGITEPNARTALQTWKRVLVVLSVNPALAMNPEPIRTLNRRGFTDAEIIAAAEDVEREWNLKGGAQTVSNPAGFVIGTFPGRIQQTRDGAAAPKPLTKAESDRSTMVARIRGYLLKKLPEGHYRAKEPSERHWPEAAETSPPDHHATKITQADVNHALNGTGWKWGKGIGLIRES